MPNHEMEVILEQLAENDLEFNILLAIAELSEPPEQRSHKPFEQGQILKGLKSYTKLAELEKKYRGLCEIISNYVISENLLGTSDELISYVLEKRILAPDENSHQKQINLAALDDYSHTHLLEESAFHAFSMAYFFDIYPFSLFTASEMLEINKNNNTELLVERLNQLATGSYVKVEVFKKELFTLSGHSMVIKKTQRGFAFFDPNTGEAHLNALHLIKAIQERKSEHSATTMAFIDGDRYIQAIQANIKPTVSRVKTDAQWLTPEILSEIKTFMTDKEFDDKNLLRCHAKLKALICEEQKHLNSSLVVFNSPHFNKEKSNQRLKDFELIKQKVNARRFASSIAEVKHYDQIGYVNAILPSIQSFDDLMAFVRAGEERFANFSNLQPLQEKANELIDSVYKYKIAYSKFPLNAMKLMKLIDSAKSMNDVFWILRNGGAEGIACRNELFSLISDQCPVFIHNLTDLINVLEYIPSSEQSDELLEMLEDRLPHILQKTQNTSHEYSRGLAMLSRDYHSLIIQTMLASLPMHVETVNSLFSLRRYLSVAEYAQLLSSVAEKIPDALGNDVCSMIEMHNLGDIICQLQDCDWQKIYRPLAKKISFFNLLILCKTTSLPKERLLSLATEALTHMPISYYTVRNKICIEKILNEMANLPEECRALILERGKILLLSELEEISSIDACRSVAAVVLFRTLITHYFEDKDVMDELIEYLINNNFKHINKGVAKPMVELLIAGLINGDPEKINAATNQYQQNKSWLSFFNSKEDLSSIRSCLPPGLMNLKPRGFVHSLSKTTRAP